MTFDEIREKHSKLENKLRKLLEKDKYPSAKLLNEAWTLANLLVERETWSGDYMIKTENNTRRLYLTTCYKIKGLMYK